MNYKERYFTAHLNYTKMRTPSVVNDGLYCLPDLPKIKTANGLTKFICNYVNWNGFRATRISSAGRYIEAKNSQGHKIAGGGQFIPSTTRKGTADISCTIAGKSVMIEIKVGNDKPSEFQLREQLKERAAGGIYEFISTPDNFFELYDKIIGLP
jgi:hypothetical protein